MILLTRLNGQAFVINAEKIRYIESTPDTVVCCDGGEKVMVKEGMAEVIRRAIEYARVIRSPLTEFATQMPARAGSATGGAFVSCA